MFFLHDNLKDGKQHCYYINTSVKDLKDNDLKFLFKILKAKDKDSDKRDMKEGTYKEVGFYMHYSLRGVRMFSLFLERMEYIQLTELKEQH